MKERPILDRSLDAATFRSYYYLKEELVGFCRAQGLQTAGGKLELTERIAHYLRTGERITTKKRAVRAVPVGTITKSSVVEAPFVCSELHRAFFKQEIGPGFSFNVAFQRWLKNNAGKTYAQAIEAYHQLLAEKKSGTTVIDQQFEYNTYIRAFFADNTGMTLQEAILCWNYKKKLQGHNRYEQADLTALGQA